jgi:hypothetical protein
MNAKQRRETDRNVRARDFLTVNNTDFADNDVAKDKIAALAAQCALVEQEYQKQMSGDVNVKQDYASADAAFADLLAAMREVRDFANSIAREIPGLDKKFRLPVGLLRRAVIAAARINADDAMQYEVSFVAYGLPATFADNLRAKADAAETALNTAEATTGTKVGATDTLARYVKDANITVETLDPIARRVYRDNPTKLAAWNYAAHLERHTPVPYAERRRKHKPSARRTKLPVVPATVVETANMEM